MADDEHELVNLAILARRQEVAGYEAERQRQMISEIVNTAHALDTRVRALEAGAQTRAITEAREDERDKTLYDRLARIEEQIKEIRGFGWKALLLIAAPLAAAVVLFFVRGGLNIH